MNFTSIRLACDRIVSYFFTFITDEQENCVLEAEVVAGSGVRWSNCWWWWLCVLVLGGWWSMSFSGIILRSFQHFKGRLGLLEKKKHMGLHRDTFGIHWQNSPLGKKKKWGVLRFPWHVSFCPEFNSAFRLITNTVLPTAFHFFPIALHKGYLYAVLIAW